MMMIMEPPAFSPAYVVSLFLILPALSIYLIVSFLSGKRNTVAKNLPPGPRGWPMLGETMEYAFFGAQKFINDKMAKYSSNVIQTSLYGERVAIFCGAQANKFIFSNESKLSTLWLPRPTRKLFYSPESIDRSVIQRPTSKPIFYDYILKKEVLKQNIPVMDALARQQMDRDWMPNNFVKVLPLSRMYILELGCRLFLGGVDRQQIKDLANSFAAMTSGMYCIPIDLPGTTFNRAIKGGILVREMIMRIVKERRKNLKSEPKEDGELDLLSKMLLVGDSSETEIHNLMVSLLVGSFDTTSYTLTSVMNYLSSLPHIYEKVFKEQMEIVKGKGPAEILTWEDIEKMKFTWNVVRESLRLMPPGTGAFRETMTEFTYASFAIPKGWKIFWSMFTSHMNPEYFPEPEKFDPSRFEGSGPAPYTFVPFGGGPGMCPGRELARVEILVFVHNVVRRFKLEKMFPDKKVVSKYSKPSPVHGLQVRLQPHKK